MCVHCCPPRRQRGSDPRDPPCRCPPRRQSAQSSPGRCRASSSHDASLAPCLVQATACPREGERKGESRTSHPLDPQADAGAFAGPPAASADCHDRTWGRLSRKVRWGDAHAEHGCEEGPGLRCPLRGGRWSVINNYFRGEGCGKAPTTSLSRCGGVWGEVENFHTKTTTLWNHFPLPRRNKPAASKDTRN